MADDVRLIVSELVTNSQQALEASADACVRLGLAYEGAVLRITLWDPSPLPPVMGLPALEGVDGRGLPIVRALSAACGWHWSEAPPGRKPFAGKVVWSECKV